MSIKGPSRSTRWSIPWPYLAAIRGGAEVDGQAAQQRVLPYIADMPEVMTPVEEAVRPLESYHQPVELETGSTLPYSLAEQNEPAVLSAASGRPNLSAISRAARNLRKLVFNSLPPEPLTSSKDFGLLPTGVASQRTPEISQSKWSMPPVKPLPEVVGQKAEVINTSEEPDSMTSSQIMITPVITDNVSLGRGRQTNQAEMPFIHSKSIFVAGLRQPLSMRESVCQAPALPFQQYPKSVGNAPPPDRIAGHDFLEKQDYEPSPLQYENTRQPSPELLLTSVAAPRLGFNAIGSEGSLPATFEGTARHRSHSTPELALAPVGRPLEAVSPPMPRAEVKAEEITREAATPDIDAIARDVYSVLKRRLAREKERALGLS